MIKFLRSSVFITRTMAAFVVACGSLISSGESAIAEPAHAIAMHGAPKFDADFSHFPYANPDAPKGGKITFGVRGSFDSLNPFIPRGSPVWWVRDNVWEKLLQRSYDEPFALYGLLAESVETPDDRSWVEFKLNSKARFSDGEPVTADDLIFTWNLLTEVGRPNYRNYATKVEKVEKKDDLTVRFTFKTGTDRELALILGLLPVLPEHATDPEQFAKTNLKPPIGSGPYRVKSVDPGASITFERDPDYWGRDLPVKRGLHNFDQLKYDFYRDSNAMFEAFKKGLFDINPEGDPDRWATVFSFPAIESGDVVKAEFDYGLPKSPDGFVFNTRRELFADVRVRRALSLLFDFEWINKNLFYGLYERTTGYFTGSELSSVGVPASDAEKALLSEYSADISSDVLDGSWLPPATDGSGRNRENARKALKLLTEAGWKLDGSTLVNAKGEPFAFEFLAKTRDQERVALPFKKSLERLGIDMRIRTVDSAQFQERIRTFDFDMIQYAWWQSLSPGNEQFGRWSAESADAQGSLNYAGVRSKAVPVVVNAMLEARKREDFIDAVRALDRVLISGAYIIPLYHAPRQWVAHWARVKHPEATSLFGYQTDTWWSADAE